MQAVVLVSGGMDSTILLHEVCRRAPRAVHAVSFHYAQKHARELACARWQCESLGKRVDSWRQVDISSYGNLTASATTLTGEAPVPELAAIPADQLDQPPTYVPNRNLIMLSLAVGLAESLGADRVFYGAQAQDEYGYWDCTADFVERLNAVLALNRRQAVSVEAPFCAMSKAAELELGLELGVDFGHTWTCYRGEEPACGVCPSCVERRRAFATVGIADPLPYAVVETDSIEEVQ